MMISDEATKKERLAFYSSPYEGSRELLEGLQSEVAKSDVSYEYERAEDYCIDDFNSSADY